MARIGGQTAPYSVLRDLQNELRAQLGTLARSLGNTLLLAADSDGKITTGKQVAVRVEIGSLVDAFFTGTIPGVRGRHPFGKDGVTPLAPYPRLIDKYLIRGIEAAVEPHYRYLRRVMPASLQEALLSSRLSELGPDDEMAPLGLPRPSVGPSSSGHGVSGVSARRRAFLDRYRGLRIFEPNPLAEYEAPHTWVDPQGYRLSDRIWQTNEATRTRIDRFVAKSINQGVSSRDVARALEQFVQPGRQGALTTKPYPAYKGRVENFSFDAMRLARTEVARAQSQATLQAARANPYVSAMDWLLGSTHPEVDICDDLARGGPYPINKRVPLPGQDSHPQCICIVVSRVGQSPAAVTAELRVAMQEAARENLKPILTPLQQNEFIGLLLGEALYKLVLSAGRDLVGVAA